MYQSLKPRVSVLIWILFLLGFTTTIRAQILPTFSISKKEGCLPLLVEFVNTTVVDTYLLQIHWYFENGNQSI